MWKLLLGAAAISILILTLSSGSSSVNTASHINQLKEVASLSDTTQGNDLLDFNLPKLGGGTLALSEYRDKKPVVLDFWASWCHNCRRDMPNLNRLYEKYSGQFEVIGVNLQESESTASKFINSKNITFPIALDNNGQVARTFGVRYTNTHFLINKDGSLLRMIPGDIEESDIISLIESNS